MVQIAKTRKQPKYPSREECVKQMWCVQTMEYYSATRKNETVSLAAAWIDLETVILNEGSQAEKDSSYDSAYMWKLKGQGI